MGVYRLSYKIDMLVNDKEAEEVSQFLLSQHSFDDQRHTPGEFNHFRNHPIISLKQEQYHYWYIRNRSGVIIGVLSGFENEQRTGGYVLDYLAVHREHRHQGIATQLIQYLIQFVKASKGRYILTYTCDLSLYAPIQYLFAQIGFKRIGYYPDYYYNGEGRITFYYKM